MAAEPHSDTRRNRSWIWVVLAGIGLLALSVWAYQPPTPDGKYWTSRGLCEEDYEVVKDGKLYNQFQAEKLRCYGSYSKTGNRWSETDTNGAHCFLEPSLFGLTEIYELNGNTETCFYPRSCFMGVIGWWESFVLTFTP